MSKSEREKKRARKSRAMHLGLRGIAAQPSRNATWSHYDCGYKGRDWILLCACQASFPFILLCDAFASSGVIMRFGPVLETMLQTHTKVRSYTLLELYIIRLIATSLLDVTWYTTVPCGRVQQSSAPSLISSHAAHDGIDPMNEIRHFSVNPVITGQGCERKREQKPRIDFFFFTFGMNEMILFRLDIPHSFPHETMPISSTRSWVNRGPPELHIKEKRRKCIKVHYCSRMYHQLKSASHSPLHESFPPVKKEKTIS